MKFNFKKRKKNIEIPKNIPAIPGRFHQPPRRVLPLESGHLPGEGRPAAKRPTGRVDPTTDCAWSANEYSSLGLESIFFKI
jgi:hypothetical protein